MYLKSLKLAGFKSFADRARLEFRPGVTVVVGPNGSGKSNLVDALSWVLGTQSTKTLRTQRMEDVIFAGTATRPSLGKAEATLVVDNSERRLDLDLDEIAITRRLYRDGSSDYELNGVGCRLIDIQDLLSDSGVGRHQHVIIGQGEIGRVLNASPEEHRAVVEEAAGILKHRRRKERSERRLERTDEDMLRLEDLLGEIARQMRPLKRQARAAERYEGLKSQVTALRLYLGGKQLAEINRDLTIATSEKSILSEGIEVDSKRVTVLAERLEDLSQAVSRTGGLLDRDTSAAALLETTSERLLRVGSIAGERSRALSGRQEAVVERRADLSEEQESIRSRLAEIESEIDNKQAEVEAAEARFRRLEDEETGLATQNSLSPEGAVAAARGELSALRSSLIRDRRETETIDHRLEVLTARIADEKNQIETLNGEIKQADSSIGDLQASYDDKSKGRTRLQDAWAEAESALEAARISKATSDARLDAVAAAIEGRYDSASRQIVESASGALGTVTSQLDIPEGLEAAVSAALGVWADAVAFESSESLVDAVESVKRSGGGSVTGVSADSEPVFSMDELVGVEPLIARLGPNHNQALAARFLDNVAIVEGWSSGWDLVTRYPGLRAVTPEGDVISAHGISIADPDGAGSAMRESAEVALERATTEFARASSIHTSAQRDFDRSRDDERHALEQLEMAESHLAGLTEAMSRLERSVSAMDAEQERLSQRRSALSESIESGEAQAVLLDERLRSLEGEEAERVRVWEDLEARRVRVAAERETARSEWQELATAHRAEVERKRLFDDRLAAIKSEIERLEGGATANVDPVRLERVVRFSKRAKAILDNRLVELRERQGELRETLATAKTDLESVRSDHESRTSGISESRARIAELDIKLTELRMRRESVVEAIRRDADGDVEAAMEAPRPELPEDADLEETMETLVTQLRRLGPINPLAAKEYRELEERHDFLAAQKADVEESRAELRKVIAALEVEIQERFDSAFAEVSEAYEKYFQVLFPGGRGRVRLADKDDPESGVLIDAQPLGKKVSQMTLLSGGERSLAALAFLFAIFDARPSPFYVLDEVEAALDDANLRRFLRIVDEFRNRAQLIIVTHQQQTMEAADVLYGVTMEPGGSSKAVRKDMSSADVKVDQVA